jgi:hypothetical protein
MRQIRPSSSTCARGVRCPPRVTARGHRFARSARVHVIDAHLSAASGFELTVEALEEAWTRAVVTGVKVA